MELPNHDVGVESRSSTRGVSLGVQIIHFLPFLVKFCPKD